MAICRKPRSSPQAAVVLLIVAFSVGLLLGAPLASCERPPRGPRAGRTSGALMSPGPQSTALLTVREDGAFVRSVADHDLLSDATPEAAEEAAADLPNAEAQTPSDRDEVAVISSESSAAETQESSEQVQAAAGVASESSVADASEGSQDVEASVAEIPSELVVPQAAAELASESSETEAETFSDEVKADHAPEAALLSLDGVASGGIDASREELQDTAMEKKRDEPERSSQVGQQTPPNVEPVDKAIEALGGDIDTTDVKLHSWHDDAVKLAKSHEKLRSDAAEIQELTGSIEVSVNEAHKSVDAASREAEEAATTAQGTLSKAISDGERHKV